jgi:hypothetical protein
MLEHMGRNKDAAAARALSDFVRQGQPDALTDRALELLGQTQSAAALPVLGEFAQHRRPAARRACYGAIARVRDARADMLLGQGLRDSDASVRGLCARALGERRAKSQLELLFRAFDRGVAEAGAAIGRSMEGSSLPRLHAFLGRAALPPLLDAYEALLLRADIDVQTKLDIIARLGEVATPGVKRFFVALMSGEHDWSLQLPVLRALADTAARIDTRVPPAERGRP